MKIQRTPPMIAILILVLTGPLMAVDITVTESAVDNVVNGNCSLIEAFHSANTDAPVDACTAGNGLDRIVLPANSEFTLLQSENDTGGGTGLPVVTSDLHVEGHESLIRRDENAPKFRLLWINSGADVVIEDLTLQRGSTVDEFGTRGSGGAIRNEGNLTLRRVQFYNNFAFGNGGAIITTNSAELEECNFLFNRVTSGNPASSGNAIWSNGFLSLEATSVNQNAGRYAISVTSDNGHLVMTNSSIIRNEDAGVQVGGGAFARIENSTLSGNDPLEQSGTLRGAGLMVDEGEVELVHVTVSDNDGSEGGGLWINPTLGQLTLSNSLIAGNVGSDCWGTVISTGGNLLGNAFGCSGLVDGVNGDIVGADPHLDPLGFNGGSTRTHLPIAPSPAIDNAGNANCLSHDQRAVARPQGTLCDIGAVEVETTLGTVSEIPVLDQWGLLVFSLLIAALAAVALRR